eukprot:796455-Pelagomonas_calceolata.AAC.1
MLTAHRDLVEGCDGRALDHAPPHLRRHRRITGHHTQHGSHVGVDHAAAFAHAPDVDRLAADHDTQGTGLGHQIYKCGWKCASCVPGGATSAHL